MLIEGMVKSSLVDYPGMASCVLFVPGCNFNCFYCHNRDLIIGTGSVIAVEEVFKFLNKRKGMLEGVVITGGEPTLYHDLIDFIKKIKALNYKVKLDTNGSNPQTVRAILKEEICDYFAVDYKAPHDRYPDICGGKADNVLKTIDILTGHNACFEVRTTVFPSLTLNDLIQMAKELPAVPKYVLNKYRKPEKFLPGDTERINAAPYTIEQIQTFAVLLKKYQPNVTA